MEMPESLTDLQKIKRCYAEVTSHIHPLIHLKRHELEATVKTTGRLLRARLNEYGLDIKVSDVDVCRLIMQDKRYHADDLY